MATCESSLATFLGTLKRSSLDDREVFTGLLAFFRTATINHNHIELRDALKKAGTKFRMGSDDRFRNARHRIIEEFRRVKCESPHQDKMYESRSGSGGC